MPSLPVVARVFAPLAVNTLSLLTGTNAVTVRSSALVLTVAFARSSVVSRERVKSAYGIGFPALSRTVTVNGISSPFFATALGRPSLLSDFAASCAVEVSSIVTASV